nr:hypothetical protein [Microbispora rosea]
MDDAENSSALRVAHMRKNSHLIFRHISQRHTACGKSSQTGPADAFMSQEGKETPIKGEEMLKMLLQQLAELLDGGGDLHIGDDSHALEPDDDADEIDDIDDDF